MSDEKWKKHSVNVASEALDVLCNSWVFGSVIEQGGDVFEDISGKTTQVQSVIGVLK